MLTFLAIVAIVIAFTGVRAAWSELKHMGALFDDLRQQYEELELRTTQLEARIHEHARELAKIEGALEALRHLHGVRDSGDDRALWN